MPSKLKSLMLEDLRSRFEDVEHCVVFSFSSVTADEMTSLRFLIRDQNGSLMVVKNSIASLAFRELGYDEFTDLLDGQVALAYGEDPASIAKAITDWNKKAKKLTMKGGLVGGSTVGEGQVQHLATLPPVDQMTAMAVGAIAAPLTSFMGVSKEVIQSFVRIVKQLSEQDGEAAGE
jgi:large subunit ribosomal protein L10